MTEAAIQEADQAFGKLVSGQLTRVSSELTRLDQLLKAGRVDARILNDFRSASERIRASGWQVQAWLDGDEHAIAVLLMEERIHLMVRLANQLAAEMTGSGRGIAGLTQLRDALQKLDGALAPEETSASL